MRLLLCRRKKEDAAEDARLAQEQDRLRLQFSKEQAKQRAKQAEQQASSSTLPVDCTTCVQGWGDLEAGQVLHPQCAAASASASLAWRRVCGCEDVRVVYVCRREVARCLSRAMWQSSSSRHQPQGGSSSSSLVAAQLKGLQTTEGRQLAQRGCLRMP